MHEQILDEVLKYGDPIEATLMQRINAVVCDVFLLIVFSYTIKHLVFLSYSTMVVSCILLIYKPFMEYLFRGTFGKMFVKIEITRINHETPSLLQVIIRNILPIGYVFISMIVASLTLVSSHKFVLGVIFVGGVISLMAIDILVLVINQQNRSLHDLLANTIVFQKSKRIKT